MNVPLGGLGKLDCQCHPSSQVLRDYIGGDLEDEWRFADDWVMKGFIRGELNDWHLSEVSLHVVACPKCAAEVARMRGVESAQARRGTVWERVYRSTQGIVAGGITKRMAYYLPLVGVTAGILIFVINVFLNSLPALGCNGGGGGEVLLMMQ